MKASKETLIQKYQEYKAKHQATPKFHEFLEFSGVPRNHLAAVFGRDAYSKLQEECGDKANRIIMKRTDRETIMRQYGDLALRLNELPRSSDWTQNQLKPTLAGLWKEPHFIPWGEFPQKFQQWVATEGIKGYEKVLDLIDAKFPRKKEKGDPEFEKLIATIRAWAPDRRRNFEEGYKVGLRGHLESLGYTVKEESGESTIDLLLNEKYMVELKKAPTLGEYDRLFGQLARHLEHHPRVIAVIFDASRGDQLRNFEGIVDKYLNNGSRIVEVIQK